MGCACAAARDTQGFGDRLCSMCPWLGFVLLWPSTPLGRVCLLRSKRSGGNYWLAQPFCLCTVPGVKAACFPLSTQAVCNCSHLLGCVTTKVWIQEGEKLSWNISVTWRGPGASPAAGATGPSLAQPLCAVPVGCLNNPPKIPGSNLC